MNLFSFFQICKAFVDISVLKSVRYGTFKEAQLVDLILGWLENSSCQQNLVGHAQISRVPFHIQPLLRENFCN